MQPTISVVVPIYRSAATIEKLCERLRDSFDKESIDHQIVLVNDGSPDDSWSIITRLTAADPRIVGVNLSRNFGQHNAILAGLHAATGDWVAVMDADLQDTPEAVLPMMREAIAESADAVIATRVGRKDGLLNSLTSRMFYSSLKKLSGIETGPDQGNFGVYSRRMVDAISDVDDLDFFLPTVVSWAGFTVRSFEVPRETRDEGRSSYNLVKRLSLAMRVLVINSNKLLQASIAVGLAASLIAIVYALYLVVAYFSGQVQVEGWTSVMVAIFFMSGVILVSNGVLGLYLGKIFDGTKGRPRYIVADRTDQ